MNTPELVRMFVPANEVGDGGESSKVCEPDRDDEPLGQDKAHRRQEGIGAVTLRDNRRAQSDYVPIDSKTTRTLDFAQCLNARNVHACALLHQILLVICRANKVNPDDLAGKFLETCIGQRVSRIAIESEHSEPPRTGKGGVRVGVL